MKMNHRLKTIKSSNFKEIAEIRGKYTIEQIGHTKQKEQLEHMKNMRSLREKLRENFIKRFRCLDGLFQRALRNQKHGRYKNELKLKE